MGDGEFGVGGVPRNSGISGDFGVEALPEGPTSTSNSSIGIELTLAGKGIRQSEPAPTLAYPPPLYYRDTFGLEPAVDEHLQSSIITEEGASEGSDETGTTKSTVRHTARIFHPDCSVPGPSLNRLLLVGQPRKPSGFSGLSDQATAGRQHSADQLSHSTQIEELLSTNRVLLAHRRPLLWLATLGFGTGLQLLLFAVVALFFDGHWLGTALGVMLLSHSVLVLLHIRRLRTRLMLLLCTLFSALAFLLSLFLFLGTAYLIHTEDKRIRNAELDFSHQQIELMQSNQIVQNARIAMYSLQLIYAPIYAICACSMFFLLFRNYGANRAGRTHKGYFLTRPITGHQSVLVPIKLQQVDQLGAEQQEDDQQGGDPNPELEREEAWGRKRRKGRQRGAGAGMQTPAGPV